ncbi:MAG: DUF4958 family protein [Alistipes senegalensis]|nr:DUF4958 family protein [Bacteroides cellulosilyticus]MCM1351700.1 DUF4958 family protein [Alistipes senegalensis]
MKPFIRKACFVLAAALCTVAFTACEDDDTAGGDLQLYYSTVVDIGPSMNYLSGTPSYHGPTPSEFAIVGVKCDDQPVEVACFSIDAATGAVSIADTDELPTGTYKLSISCRAGGGTFRFSDIFVVRMVAAAPAELEVSASTLDIPFDELATTDVSVTVTPVGETVSILSYALQQEEGREYFAISNKGVITLNSGFKGEVLPGTYPLPICITTRAGKYTYENLLTVRITSAPLEIAYPVASGRMEVDRAFTGMAPTMKGSSEQTVWAIEKIASSDGSDATGKIVIDPATGVISVGENSGLPLDAVYTLDLRVTNEFGSAVFEGAYTLTVIAYIEPIDPTTFGYDDVQMIQGGTFSASPKAGLVGDEVKFELGELPAELAGQIQIDAMGVVSSAEKNKIPLGEHSIPVKVENMKSSAETILKLTVVENPYYFTKIVYGNNLGLEPAENYANQYRCASASEMKALSLTPTTDAKPGTQLEWSVKSKHNCGGTTIDSDTGILVMSGFKAGNGGLIFVTATAGKGQPGETSVTVPVFFYFNQAVDGVSIFYAPFVLQVNPKVGGRSLAPTVEGVDDPSQFLLDYRRTFNYYNFQGPVSHVDGQPTVDGFLRNHIWQPYYEAISDSDPAAMAAKGNRAPVSYYDNKNRLSVPAAYVDPATKEVVVNPNKWLDTNGNSASGMFHGQMTFVVNGQESGVAGSKSQIFPIWIWFDENF